MSRGLGDVYKRQGNAPSYKLFEAVKVARKPGVDLARAFSDYEVTLPEQLPEGVTCTCME